MKKLISGSLLIIPMLVLNARTLKQDLAKKPVPSRIGYFDERSMNFCALNENDGSIDTLAHIDEPSSGGFRRTVWSPDGKQFAFTGTVDGIRGTHIANADGSGLRLVLRPARNSPEGVLDWHKEAGLIFVLKNIDGNAEIYSVKDSLHLKNLTGLPSWEIFPAVFPDGRISFVSNVDESSTDVAKATFKNVYVLDPNKKGHRLLLTVEGMDMSTVANTGIFPDISPDGKTMCFTLKGDIYTIGTDGRNMVNVTKTQGLTEMTPSFSPDGRYIVFSGASNPAKDYSSKRPNMNLYRIDIRSGKKVQITFGKDNFFTHPIYQPLG